MLRLPTRIDQWVGEETFWLASVLVAIGATMSLNTLLRPGGMFIIGLGATVSLTGWLDSRKKKARPKLRLIHPPNDSKLKRHP